MNMKTGQIARAVREFAADMVGGFVEKIVQTADDTVVVSVKTGGRRFHLLLSVSSVNGRVHLLTAAPEEKIDYTSFGRTLKQTLGRGYLSAVEQRGGDRIVVVTFETSFGTRHLLAELTGTKGELYLTDGGFTVIGRAHGRGSSTPTGAIWTPPVSSPPVDEGADEPVEGAGKLAYNRALETRYVPLAAAEKIARLRHAASTPLRTELKRLRKRKKDVAVERARLTEYAEDKRWGDLLQANFHRLVKGAAAVVVDDLFADAAPVTLPLDPALSPQENIARHYKRYRRYEKGIPRIDEETAALNNKEARIVAALTAIERATTEKEITPHLPKAKREPASVPVKKAKKGAPPQKRPVGRRFVSSEGYDIFVGKDDRENDELSVRIANGRDLWLHARDYPGSHVVVRLPKNLRDLPQATLREAAMLAIRYSKLAKAGQGEVTWCYAKDVSKPKGFPPGKVMVAGAKSIRVTIDADAVEAMRLRGE